MNRVGDSLQHFGPNRELVEAFAQRAVEFVLVGGLAVAWYCESRQADDMDLLINPTTENSEKISVALGGLGLQGFKPTSFAKLGLQVPIKERFHAELLTPLAVGPSYEEVHATAVAAKLFQMPVLVASPAMLVRMKEHVVVASIEQSQKHLYDIARLKPHVV